MAKMFIHRPSAIDNLTIRPRLLWQLYAEQIRVYTEGIRNGAISLEAIDEFNQLNTGMKLSGNRIKFYIMSFASNAPPQESAPRGILAIQAEGELKVIFTDNFLVVKLKRN